MSSPRMAGQNSAIVAMLVIASLVTIAGWFSMPAAEARPAHRGCVVNRFEVVPNAIEKLKGQIEEMAGRRYTALKVSSYLRLNGIFYVAVSADERSYVSQILSWRASSKSV